MLDASSDREYGQKDVEGDRAGKVVYMRDLSGVSADLTFCWLDEVGDYVSDSPLLVHDSGPEYIAKEVQEDCEARGISTMKIPGAAGAFLNSCDNPFNSQLRQAYFKKKNQTYEDKLQAILDAYHAPSEASLVKYFEHVGWKGKCPTRRYVRNLLSEGFRPGHKHQKEHEEMLRVYRAWRKNLREANTRTKQENENPDEREYWYIWD